MISNLQKDTIKTLIQPLIEQMSTMIKSQNETNKIIIEQRQEIKELLSHQQEMQQQIKQQQGQIIALENQIQSSQENTCDHILKQIVEENKKLIESIMLILDKKQQHAEQIIDPIVNNAGPEEIINQSLQIPVLNYENRIFKSNQSPNSHAQLLFRTKTGQKIHIDGCKHLSYSRIPVTIEEAHLRNLEYCKICCLAFYIQENQF